ncbi:unnamed protein product [Lota lota]
MDQSLFRILLHTYALSGILGRHVFMSLPRNWTDAQAVCRATYTDLSPVTSWRDTTRLYQASRGRLYNSWVGLHRTSPNSSVWRWSGGGIATIYQCWEFGEPNNWGGGEAAVEIYASGRWNDVGESFELPFFCISLLVVSETMRWEEALEHCRGRQSDLLGMPSDTKLLLALRDLQKTNTTQRVWIGLRYLRSRWLWVNGNPMQFQGWSTARGTPGITGENTHPQYPHCPILDEACGAMTRQGVWEARDCQEELSFICD